MSDVTKPEDAVRVKSTPSFKLKDQPSRVWQAIHLKRQFGFVPETIIIEKVHGQNNRLIIRAVLTPEEIAKEDKELEKASKQAKTAVEEKKKPV